MIEAQERHEKSPKKVTSTHARCGSSGGLLIYIYCAGCDLAVHYLRAGVPARAVVSELHGGGARLPSEVAAPAGTERGELRLPPTHCCRHVTDV